MTTTESNPDVAAAPAADMLAVRPRLRHDVLFADTGDGVVLRDADEGYVLKGRTAYRFTASLAPFLTGELTVGDLCARLDPGRQAMIVDFVQNLIERGFARDARPSVDAELDDAVRERFGSQLDYVEHYADDAVNRFLAFRTSRVLVLGTGRVARAAALSLLRNGLQRVELVASGPAGKEVLAELTAVAEELMAAGCPAEAKVAGLAVEEALSAEVLAEHDIVIVSAEDVGLATVRRLVDVSVRSGGPVVLPAAVIGSRVVIGPVTRPAAAPCWTCAMLRYSANAEPADAAGLWQELALPQLATTGQPLGPQLAAMVGNMLAFDLFRLTTDSIEAETDAGVLVQDIATLAARRERLWAHPLCPSCADHQQHGDAAAVATSVLDDGAQPVGSPGFQPIEKVELGALLTDVDELVGDRLGVVSAFDDAVLDQSPVKVSRVRFGSPVRPGEPARLINAFDLHYVPVARRTALRAAALAYVGQVASARDAVTGTAAELDGSVPAEQLLLWSGLPVGAHESQQWLAATSLISGQRQLVPAAAVYPFSALNDGQRFEASSGGDGAGATLGEAVRAGLLSALAYQAVRDAAAGRVEGRPVVTAPADQGSELEFLQRTLANLDLDVQLTELSGWENASIVLAQVADAGAPEPRWTVEAALYPEPAVIGALRDVVGVAQLHRQLGSDAAVDLGQPLLSQLDVRAVRVGARPVTGASPAGAVPRQYSALVSELAARGYDVLAVETTTPDLRTQGGVVTARVLLRRAR